MWLFSPLRSESRMSDSPFQLRNYSQLLFRKRPPLAIDSFRARFVVLKESLATVATADDVTARTRILDSHLASHSGDVTASSNMSILGTDPHGTRLYRRLATGTPHDHANLPITNRRYSRLPTCATDSGLAGCHFCQFRAGPVFEISITAKLRDDTL